jgi:ribonuclease BN (tRNA processing enzyme)
MLRVAPLGTNGYFPSFGRQTMSFLVLGGERALVLDAGTGLARLIEPETAALLGPAAGLDIVLSHYHLDHVVGLSYLPAVWPRGPVRLFAPAFPLVDAEPEETLERLLSPPLVSSPLSRFPGPVEVIAVREEEFEAGGAAVRVWRQNHPGGSIGIRLGSDLAYLTDTTVDPEALAGAAGVKLLIHEVWSTDEEAAAAAAKGHSHVSAVAEFARLARVRQILAVHHHPKRSQSEIRAIAERLAELAGIPATCGEEGRLLEMAG